VGKTGSPLDRFSHLPSGLEEQERFNHYKIQTMHMERHSRNSSLSMVTIVTYGCHSMISTSRSQSVIFNQRVN